MWVAVYLFVLCLVHIQFKYCANIGVAVIKLLETAAIVLALRLYSQSDELWEYADISSWEILVEKLKSSI